MSENIVLTFAILYASVIALICAVYVLIMHKKKSKTLPEVVVSND